MSESHSEPREVFPLVVFNRPRLGMTAGQKEGIIPADPVHILPAENVIDFRPKAIPANVQLPEPQAPAGDAESPKAADSSATDSASESDGGSSTSGEPSTPTEIQPTSPTSPSEPPEASASAEKDTPATMPALPVRTIGASLQPAGTTGEPPAA